MTENMLDASMRPNHTETREVGKVAGKRSRLDVQIDGGNGFYQFSLLTRRAVAWKKRNVAAGSWNGGNDRTFYSDDGRYARDIADAMTAAGLRVA